MGSACTFQSVGGPVRRHSFTFLPGLEDPAGVTCLALMERGGFRLVRVWQSPGSLVCGQAASSHFCYFILEKVAMETGTGDGSQPGRERQSFKLKETNMLTHIHAPKTQPCV